MPFIGIWCCALGHHNGWMWPGRVDSTGPHSYITTNLRECINPLGLAWCLNEALASYSLGLQCIHASCRQRAYITLQNTMRPLKSLNRFPSFPLVSGCPGSLQQIPSRTRLSLSDSPIPIWSGIDSDLSVCSRVRQDNGGVEPFKVGLSDLFSNSKLYLNLFHIL